MNLRYITLLLLIEILAVSPRTARAARGDAAVQIVGMDHQVKRDGRNMQSNQDYVLEIVGLGVTFEKYRQGALWGELAKGDAYSSLRETDPKKYPWSISDKHVYSGTRACHALYNGGYHMPEYWGVPSFYASMPDLDPSEQPSSTNPVIGLAGCGETNGMGWHLFISGEWALAEHPDRLLEQVFHFFDSHPDVPLVVLSAADSASLRHLKRAPNSPRLITEGHYVPSWPDAAAVLVLARRDRVEAIRHFAWDDLNNNFGQEKLRMMYYDLKRTVPYPPRERRPDQPLERYPTVAEWEAATASFAKRSDIRDGWGNYKLTSKWKPTPWFPVPWSQEQLAAFDRLPTLGYLHRPVFVKMVNDKGEPLTRRADREAVLQKGWQQAARSTLPSRVIVGTDNNTDQMVMFHSLLRQITAEGGPEFDPNKQLQFIDTDRRLNNTGAATFFMQIAIGVLGSYREGGISAAFNLRDPSEASIILVSPAPEEKRKTQKHPAGGDVFRHKVEPLDDPRVYEQK